MRTRRSSEGFSGGSVCTVCTVTHNSAPHLEGWWQALCALHRHLEDQEARTQKNSYPNLSLQVVAVDCASDDDSVALLESFRERGDGPPLIVVSCTENLGFSGGMNRGIAILSKGDLQGRERLQSGEQSGEQSAASWLFAVNPDARPTPTSLQHLVAAFHRYAPRHPESEADNQFRVGSVTGRLFRPSSSGPSPSASASHTGLLDACGMYWTSSWRHFDRGSGEPNDGRYNKAEEVFAGTGAGTLYLMEALRDVALETSATRAQIFDEDFHSFREDAELGLRLQRRGWHCVYEPRAVIEHRRHNLPQRRQEMSTAINFHSLKNRYLLRILHQTFSNALRTLPALLRDLAILPYVVVRERSSLGAYSWLWRNRSRLFARRRWLHERQTASNNINQWFSHRSLPLRTRPLQPDTSTDASQSTP